MELKSKIYKEFMNSKGRPLKGKRGENIKHLPSTKNAQPTNDNIDRGKTFLSF